MSVVGIDLGTTNTVAGCVRGGKVHVLADENGVRLLPSVVSFHPSGEVLVGSTAKARRLIDAKNTVYSHKRLIGRSWNSPEIAEARQRFAFELREGPGQGPLVHARGQDYTLPEISAFVLRRAKQISERALGAPLERAVITVPAHFNELQRASTKVAGRVSGLEVLRILNEPTAAALAYGLGRSGSERVAVYDFGGGTFDCTLLDLNGNVFEVLATAGDSFLGGDDVDSAIADRMAEMFLKQYRQDARQDPQMFERLKATAEDVKIGLSTNASHTVLIKDFAHGSGGKAVHFQFTLTRRDLEAMITPLIERTFKVTQDALALARLSTSSFDKVILVGGSTRIPLVRQRVESFFGTPPMDRVNPDEVVAIGAAIQAAALTEGIRRRSIPAPPPVAKRPSQSDTQETETSCIDPTLLRNEMATEPPGPPPAGLRSAFASTLASPGPRTKAPGVGARAPSLNRAPAIPLRMEARPSTKPTKPPTFGRHDDSLAFPDLAAPAPFDWSPPESETHGGAPAAVTDRDPARPDASSVPTVPDAVPGARPKMPGGRTASAGSAPGAFGAIDEPPSHVASANPTAISPMMTARPPKDARDALLDRNDLPAVVAKAKPTRAPGRLGSLPSVPPAMSARPPPLVAPQPFGPMERNDDPVTTVASPQHRGPAANPPIGAGAKNVPLAPPPAPTHQPRLTSPGALGITAPLGRAPSAAPPPLPSPYAAPLPPPPPAPHTQSSYASPPPPAYTQPSPYASAPPPPRNFSPPPGHQPFSFGTAPPGTFGSIPPPQLGQGRSVPPGPMPSSPPPTYGSPPAPAPMAHGAFPESISQGPAAPQNVQYKAPVLVDVTPRGLVVETAGGYTDTIIPRNSKIPCERTRRFATGRDMQTTVRVRVAQGESTTFPQNTYLGEVELSGLRAAARGEVTVSVTFEVDADGTLRVRARDVHTGQEAHATLQLVGVADESSVVMMMNRFAQQSIVGEPSKT